MLLLFGIRLLPVFAGLVIVSVLRLRLRLHLRLLLLLLIVIIIIVIVLADFAGLFNVHSLRNLLLLLVLRVERARAGGAFLLFRLI